MQIIIFLKKRKQIIKTFFVDNEEMVELMLKNGGNGEIANKAGETVLSWAASRGIEYNIAHNRIFGAALIEFMV